MDPIFYHRNISNIILFINLFFKKMNCIYNHNIYLTPVTKYIIKILKSRK
jgi:hypothetical protein